MQEVVIVAAARTPMGSFQGALAKVPAPELGSVAIRACLQRSGVSPDQVDEVYMGMVLPAGVGQAAAARLVDAVRVALVDLLPEDDDAAWEHVRQHEQRFLQALRQGSAAEGDDASC